MERQEHARRQSGEARARETRQTFLPTVPNGFRGSVQPGPEGAPYLAVSDGARFILAPVTPEARALSARGHRFIHDSPKVADTRPAR